MQGPIQEEDNALTVKKGVETSTSTSPSGGEPVGGNAFRDVPFMGVIFVVAEASKLGFYNGHPDWCNLGQGQPEVGEMEGAPPRFSSLTLEPSDHAYGPLGGNTPMKEAVAAHYNRLYRTPAGLPPFRPENVSVAAGGRMMITRAFAALGLINIGYMVPDYTAYEDHFDYHFHHIRTACLFTKPENGFLLTPAEFREFVQQHKLDAFLLSNPCNPTGQVIQGDALKEIIEIGREHNCLLIMDEFYSHFIYNSDGSPADSGVSAAEYLRHIDDDPVLIIDGLTKGFRYPGWRVGWCVGPRNLIGTLDRAGSAIDGGPSQPMQRAAVQILQPERADQELNALRKVFGRKRAMMAERLKAMGIKPVDGSATFYIWADISELPAPLNDGMAFFYEGLKHRVMTVPGVFFDVNPKKERKGKSPYSQWVRFSFGPPAENVKMGLDRLEKMIEDVRQAALAEKNN